VVEVRPAAGGPSLHPIPPSARDPAVRHTQSSTIDAIGDPQDHHMSLIRSIESVREANLGRHRRRRVRPAGVEEGRVPAKNYLTATP